MSEILPEQTESRISQERQLHFVNREQAMKSLLRVHLSQFARRSHVRAHSGGSIEFPLMDSLYGMGKTTFAWNYLSMVARFISNAKSRFPIDLSDADIDEMVCDTVREAILHHDQASGGGLESDTNISIDHNKFLRPFLAELRGARTLYIDCSGMSLLDGNTRGINLMNMIKTGLKKWGISNIEDNITWSEFIHSRLYKPVFIVFDEIGSAFRSSNGDLETERNEFFNFVSQYCEPLSKMDEMYYLLCGKAPFLWNVGMRPEQGSPIYRNNSPGTFRRIQLNPIRMQYIDEILKKHFSMVGDWINFCCQNVMDYYHWIQSFESYTNQRVVTRVRCSIWYLVTIKCRGTRTRCWRT
jgi:hypothetical protein